MLHDGLSSCRGVPIGWNGHWGEEQGHEESIDGHEEDWKLSCNFLAVLWYFNPAHISMELDRTCMLVPSYGSYTGSIWACWPSNVSWFLTAFSSYGERGWGAGEESLKHVCELSLDSHAQWGVCDFTVLALAYVRGWQVLSLAISSHTNVLLIMAELDRVVHRWNWNP